jgi:hypothetical protein
VAIYVVMAGLVTGMWFVDHWRTTGTYLYWVMLLACRLFLGGYYRGGLVKPFSNKPPRERVEPHPFLALGLRIYATVPVDDRAYRNDERELQQRDHAHYLAYQAVGVALVVPWMMADMRMLKPQWMHWAGMSADQILYGVMLAIVLIVFTLPQAILLWTEPDMEDVG